MKNQLNDDYFEIETKYKVFERRLLLTISALIIFNFSIISRFIFIYLRVISYRIISCYKLTSFEFYKKLLKKE